MCKTKLDPKPNFFVLPHLNYIFVNMKKIHLPILGLLFTVSVFGQVKTPNAAPDAKTASKPLTRPGEVKPVPTEVIQEIEANMINIPAGTFVMGCVNEQDSACYYWEKPSHKVSISSFYLNKYDVTQKEWEAVTGKTPWFSKACADCPVENISWYDAQVFINKLNQITGRNYRLPTEAEWEYAAGGGNKSHGYKFSGSNNPDEVAWYDKNSSKQSHPVGQKKPNELGLYDMSGNVFQWCSDWFDEKYYTSSPSDNPVGPRTGAYRAVRGGSWWSEVNQGRTICRDRYPSDAKDDDVGIRLARD